MRIFINERPHDVQEGSTALSALRAVAADLAASVESGAGYITDGRAILLGGDAPLSPGDILRVVVSSRRRGDPDHADA